MEDRWVKIARDELPNGRRSVGCPRKKWSVEGKGL